MDQGSGLPFAQVSPSALGKGPQRERADGDADEAKDFDAERIEEAADLPVLAFVQNDLEPTRLRPPAQEADAPCGEPFVFVGRDTALDSFDEIVISGSADLHVVGLLDMVLGREDRRGPAGVVREEEESFARFVETADRRDPGEMGICKAAVDRVAALLVRRRRDEAARFVQEKVDPWQSEDAPAIDLDPVPLEVQPGRGVTFEPAVERDASIADEFLGGLAGRVTKLGESSREADPSARRRGSLTFLLLA
jgi:hypothetical protein